jgi:hypothetical protein
MKRAWLEVSVTQFEQRTPTVLLLPYILFYMYAGSKYTP